MNPQNGEVMYSVGRGRGSWRPNQTPLELRRPQSSSLSSDVPESSSTSSVPSDNRNSDLLAIAARSTLSVNAKEFQSTLSVNAKEFVPKNFTSAAVDSFVQNADPATNSFDEYSHHDENYEEEDYLYEHLNEMIINLTKSPGHFDQFLKSLLHDLSPMLATEDTVEIIVSAILEQSITERNFRYNGARLCKALDNRYQPGGKSVFRRILLNKLSEEHEKIENNLETDSNRVYGFIHFLGEVYIQLELTRGVRIAVVGDALLEALKILIQVPLLDNVKNTCEVLKLAGRTLDVDNSDEMNSLFLDLKNLLEDERAGVRVKEMIRNILKLRSENWGHAMSSDESSSASTNSGANKSVMPALISEGINYGPDGQALTAEEMKFMNESCEDNESVSVGDDTTVWDPEVNENENAEIMAAFKEFISQKPKS